MSHKCYLLFGMIRIKRAYEPPEPADGVRFLIDALWPRGVGKSALSIDEWLREVAPSTELRRWFGHDPSRWLEFKRRYFAELRRNPHSWQPIQEASRKGDVTLVFGAKDTEHNNAVALLAFLETQHRSRGREALGKGIPRGKKSQPAIRSRKLGATSTRRQILVRR